MKKMIGALLLALVLGSGGVGALEIGEYSIGFDIQASGEVLEELKIIFSEPLNDTKKNSLRLGDVSGVSVLADGKPLETETVKDGDDFVVGFSTPEGTEELLISFKAGGLVFQSGEILHFFTELKPPAGIGTIGVKVVLPKGFVLHGDAYFPSGAEMGSDGERISLDWSLDGGSQL